MRKYKNIKTQAVIETACVINGGDWILMDEKTAKKSNNKATKKKSGDLA